MNTQEANRFLEELQKESDRAAAVLGAAILDDQLRQLIGNHIIADKAIERSLLDEVHSPLGSFSGRIIAGYAFGLIEQRVYNDLQIIRRIRNYFAHDPLYLSFESDSVRDRCLNLQLPERPQPERKIPPRILFNWSVSTNLFVIEEKAQRVVKSRTQPAESLFDELERNFEAIDIKEVKTREIPPLSDGEIEAIKTEIHALSGLTKAEIEIISLDWEIFSVKFALLTGAETADTIRAKLRNMGKLP